MKVILIQDVKSLGKKETLVEVSDGYGRNYLIPRKLAIEATPKNITELKNAELSKKIQDEKERASAKELAEKIQSCTVKIQRSSGADDKMYGSVSSKDIGDALREQFGLEVDKRKINLDEPIKNYGSYSASVKLYSDISGIINFVVTK